MVDSHLKDHLLFLPWKKSNHPQQGQDRSQRPGFLLHFKVQFFGTSRQLLSGLTPHPGSSKLFPAAVHFRLPTGACIGDCMAMDHAVDWATWSHVPGQGVWECMGERASQGGQESTFLVDLGWYNLGLRMDQVHSQNDRSTSQTLAHFRWFHLPTNAFSSQSKLTSLFGL